MEVNDVSGVEKEGMKGWENEEGLEMNGVSGLERKEKAWMENS